MSRISRGDEDTAGGQEDSSSPAPPQRVSDEPSELQGIVQPVNASVKSVSEAELAMVASKAAVTRRLEPLTLFHLRDALMVNKCHQNTRTIVLMHSWEYNIIQCNLDYPDLIYPEPRLSGLA